jgi:CRP/FNR family cyclic AMP-dependent transcriptional regulator
MVVKSRGSLLSQVFLEDTDSRTRSRVYRDKEVIYSQQSRATAIFIIQNGMVKLTMNTLGRSKKAVLAVLQKGDLFGEGCLGQQTRRMSSATSIGPSTITRLSKTVLLREIDRDQALGAMITACLVSRTARFEADLADHFLNFSERRLARILLMNRNTERSTGRPSVCLNQSALAEMVGTTRARVNSFMNNFRKQGYIRYNRSELEIDSARLATFLRAPTSYGAASLGL